MCLTILYWRCSMSNQHYFWIPQWQPKGTEIKLFHLVKSYSHSFFESEFKSWNAMGRYFGSIAFLNIIQNQPVIVTSLWYHNSILKHLSLLAYHPKLLNYLIFASSDEIINSLFSYLCKESQAFFILLQGHVFHSKYLRILL